MATAPESYEAAAEELQTIRNWLDDLAARQTASTSMMVRAGFLEGFLLNQPEKAVDPEADDEPVEAVVEET